MDAVDISRGDYATLFGEPVANVCHLLAAVVLVETVVNDPWTKKRDDDEDLELASPHRRFDWSTLMSVVVAYTPDAYGEAALSLGAAEAKHRRTDLVVVNATKGDASVDTKYANAAEMEVMLAGLAESGIDVTVRRDVTADLAHLVIDVAKETNASLVVVGIRYRSPVGKALLGSVAQRIVLDAPCPVMTVKPAA